MKIRLSEIKEVEPKREHGDIESLTQSIKDIGLICPLAVDENHNLLAGRRRYQVIKSLGWEEVDCHIISTNGNPLKAFKVALDENLKRKPLTDPEVAVAIKEYDELKRKLEGSAPEQGGRPKTDNDVISYGWSQRDTAKDLGISQPAVVKAIKIAQAIEERPQLASLGSGQRILSEYKRQTSTPVIAPIGIYKTIVIDPPWPIEKIEREVRPNQFDYDYPIMTVEEIKAFQPPIDIEGCHIYLWVTQKYLPAGIEIFEAWGVRYQCLLTWVKNVGFTPFSWMYSTEHCLFGHVGSLPLLKLGIRLDFQGKVREHSRKPDEFYEVVKSVSPEPRIDIFSREKRDGFSQYGNETDRFTA